MKLGNAAAGVQRMFLDTSAVVYHVQGVVKYQPLTDWVFKQIKNGVFSAVTGPITLAECLVLPYRLSDTALIKRFTNTLTVGPNTLFVGLDYCSERAAELRAKYNLGLLDAFQVANALFAGCDALLTNDQMLRRVSEIKILILDDLEI